MKKRVFLRSASNLRVITGSRWLQAFILCTAFSLLPAVSHASWTTVGVDNPKQFAGSHSLDIALDSSGNPHVVYGDDGLYYAYYDGSTWHYETVDPAGRAGSLVIDQSDSVHIAYFGWGLKYATKASGSWSVSTVDINGGQYASIDLDAAGKVYMSYYSGSSGDLRYATNYGVTSGTGNCTNTDWNCEAVDSTGDVGLYTSIRATSTGYACISYYDATNGDLKMAAGTFGLWFTYTLDSTGDTGLYTSITGDSGGGIHISYYDATAGDLKYATSSGVAPGSGSCIYTNYDCRTVDSAGDVGKYSSITIDTSDVVSIAYQDVTNGSLKLTRTVSGCSGSIWSKWTLAAGNTGQYASIDAEPSGTPHISYFDAGNSSLMYTQFDVNTGMPVATSIVDTAEGGDVGAHTSIAADSSGAVHISYYDATAGDLKYATNASGSWVLTTLDSAGNVGMYTSLAIDSTGTVHISYYDVTNDSLRYATNRGVIPGSGSCTDTKWDCNALAAGGAATAIIIDSSDNIHISYKISGIGYATNRGVTPGTGTCLNMNWDCETVDTLSDGSDLSIALDSAGNVHIAAAGIRYATNRGVAPGTGTCSNTNWDCETVSVGGSEPSMTVDSADNVHISYYIDPLAGSEGLWYATNSGVSPGSGTCLNTDWDCEKLSDTSGIFFTSIAMDSADNMHIVHGPSLGYVTNRSVAPGSGSCTNTDWDCEAVDSEGWYVSIAPDSVDNMHISYYAASNGDLMYATNNNRLDVTKSGTGTGTVTSSPAGIDCGGTCFAEYASQTTVNLTPAADSSSEFTGWSGPPDCADGIVRMDVSKTCTANFELLRSLFVTKPGTGTGMVTSSPQGIDCGNTCSGLFAHGTDVTLTASADTGSSFLNWMGDCTGPGTCQVTMTSAKSVTALFLINYYTLDVIKSGTGTGTVTSSPSGIDCGTDCAEDYAYNTSVTLTATPDNGSTFTSWSGGGCSGTGTCQVSVTEATSVTATFDLPVLLTTSVSPSGNGSINPDCSGGCQYDSGTVVIMNVIEDSGYPFISWTGCDAPSGSNCTMTMDTDKTLTAVFDSCMFPVKAMGMHNWDFYPTIQTAYDELFGLVNMQSMAKTLTEDLNFNSNKLVQIVSGFNCNYTSIIGITTIVGNMTVSDGSVIILDGTLTIQ